MDIDFPYVIAACLLVWILLTVAFIDYRVRRAGRDPNENRDDKS